MFYGVLVPFPLMFCYLCYITCLEFYNALTYQALKITNFGSSCFYYFFTLLILHGDSLNACFNILF